MEKDFNDEPNTTLHLQGGLGNLLFQIASIKSFSDTNNKSVQFTNFQSLSNESIALGRVTFPEFKSTIFKNINHEFDFNSKVSRKVFAEDFYFQNLDFLLENEYNHLICYLQSYHFFKSRKYVKSLFDLSSIKIESNLEKLLSNHVCTSVHIRRTDFLTNQNIFIMPSLSYYKNALEEIGDSEYTLVFSDDEEWCRNNVEFNENCLFINSDDLSCLKIMSLCQKQIMANSTFSWWGAYLSDATKVVLPEVWYRPESNQRPLSDRKLSEWISI